jgi:alpha-beta hydrolase superfamily lysophospholipase
MRLSAKWRSSWTVHSNGIERGRIETVRIGAEWVDVARLGRGDPLVVVPGLAGNWKLVLPLARLLARNFDVIVPGMRGDGFVWGQLAQPAPRVGDVGGYADDLASILGQLGVECPALLGVSFGGAIALEYAVQHPQRLSALVSAIRCRLTARSLTSFSISFMARNRNPVRWWISWLTGSGKPTKK